MRRDLLASLVGIALGLGWGSGSASSAPVKMTVSVDGTTRSAVVYPGASASSDPSPLVFVFHGLAADPATEQSRTQFPKAWPEATVVYPQGLFTELPFVGFNGLGWQFAPGKYSDRDLRF